MTRDKLQDVENTDKAIALTAIDLSNSSSLSQNVKLRSILQENIGTLKTSSNGTSVAQLRKSKRIQRKKHVNEVTSTLPLKNGDYFTEISNLKHKSSAIVLPIGTNDNSCWYRNCLYENSEEARENLVLTISSSSTANQDSVISGKAQKTSAIDALRKKVIKYPIDISSPMSRHKQNLFHQLVKN